MSLIFLIPIQQINTNRSKIKTKRTAFIFLFFQNNVFFVEVEEVLLKLDTAIPCGLIVNELISNALKYAFADQDSGNINVSIKTTGEDQYCLEVGDDGKGLEEGFVVEDSDSLGLQLVVTLVDQIDGELEVIRDNGLKFIIRFKDL